MWLRVARTKVVVADNFTFFLINLLFFQEEAVIEQHEKLNDTKVAMLSTRKQFKITNGLFLLKPDVFTQLSYEPILSYELDRLT